MVSAALCLTVSKVLSSPHCLANPLASTSKMRVSTQPPIQSINHHGATSLGAGSGSIYGRVNFDTLRKASFTSCKIWHSWRSSCSPQREKFARNSGAASRGMYCAVVSSMRFSTLFLGRVGLPDSYNIETARIDWPFRPRQWRLWLRPRRRCRRRGRRSR